MELHSTKQYGNQTQHRLKAVTEPQIGGIKDFLVYFLNISEFFHYSLLYVRIDHRHRTVYQTRLNHLNLKASMSLAIIHALTTLKANYPLH